MDAAQALFLQGGFASTSVDEIVRAADVAKGTFYVYFKTKDDILLALRERFISGFCERLESALASPPAEDWRRRLDTFVATAVTGYLDHVSLHDLVFHEYRPSNRRMKRDNPVILRLSGFLSDGAAHGAWSLGDSRLTAVMLFNAIHGAVDDNVVDPEPMQRNELVTTAQTFCRRALGLD